MNKNLLIALITIIGFLPSWASANPQRGKDLHDANCMSCHASLTGGAANTIYTRSDRRVNSLDGLKSQVERCNSTVGVSWDNKEITDVVDYLNKNFYQLK